MSFAKPDAINVMPTDVGFRTLTTYKTMTDYRQIITIEPGKRGGKPCIRHMRITVYDVLGWLAAEMSFEEILDDFPELTTQDILACLAFAADRNHRYAAWGV